MSFRALLLLALAWLVAPAIASGQAPDPTPAQPTPPAATQAAPASAFESAGLLGRGATEWMATLGSAWGVAIFHSARGHQYVAQTISWGRVLSEPKFSNRLLRGRFEWAVEVTPVYGQYHPDHVYGIGISPLTWRWNFDPRGRYAPYGELAGGLMKSSAPVPPGTTSANFTAHAGAGVRILIPRFKQQALVLLYRFDHMSNGNRLDRNPGVNAQAIHVGWTLLRPSSETRKQGSGTRNQESGTGQESARRDQDQR